MYTITYCMLHIVCAKRIKQYMGGFKSIKSADWSKSIGDVSGFGTKCSKVHLNVMCGCPQNTPSHFCIGVFPAQQPGQQCEQRGNV